MEIANHFHMKISKHFQRFPKIFKDFHGRHGFSWGWKSLQNSVVYVVNIRDLSKAKGGALVKYYSLLISFYPLYI